MASPSTTKEFLVLLQASKLLEQRQLVKAWERILVDKPAATQSAAAACDAFLSLGLLTEFQGKQLLAGRNKGFYVGKYRILDLIGAGAMGRVYLAEHVTMKRRVALKVLPAGSHQNPASLERFHREARAAASVNHPNVVRSFDIDVDEGCHYIVMEFVDGISLQDLVKQKGTVAWSTASEWIMQAARGLEHAHEMGLVHRDIKPANILIDKTGTVKVLDLGLARIANADDDDPLTRKYNEQLLGTADYLAPEQAVDSHTVDIRADIYALGCTFYFLLTGRAPFANVSFAQKLMAHQTERPAPVTEVDPEIPVEIVAILDRMMAKAKEDRFRRPGEVADALAHALAWCTAPAGQRASVAAQAAFSRETLIGPTSDGSSIHTGSSILRAGVGKSVEYVTPPPGSTVIGHKSKAGTSTTIRKTIPAVPISERPTEEVATAETSISIRRRRTESVLHPPATAPHASMLNSNTIILVLVIVAFVTTMIHWLFMSP